MTPPLRILHVEDDPVDAELIRRTLAAGGLNVECEQVATPEEFKAAVTAGRFDVILSDYRLPQFDGMAALELAQAHCPETPFIFVSGTIGEERAILALRCGATDYVLKDGLARLPAAIHRAVAEFTQREERRRLEEEIRLLLTIALAISEADGLDGAFAIALQRICDVTGWKMGQAWMPRSDGQALECSPAWCATITGLDAFRSKNESLVIFPGQQNLPARAWVGHHAVWESQITDQNRCTRAAWMREAGFVKGVAIPVLADHRTVAVMEFFDTEERSDDQRLVELISGVAAQIGAIVLHKRAEEGVKAALRVKDHLLREVHHRVKNNMQVISSLLSLQANSIENPIVRLLFRESQARIQAMAVVHEKLYGSPDLSRVDFAEYLNSLAGSLFRLYGVDRSRVALEIDAAGVFLSLDFAMPCGLIVNELVSNALKHGFPGNRSGLVRVSVSLGPDDDELTLVCRDTGVGLPDGFQDCPTGSLGLRLVKMLVEQLGGRLEFERSNGTTVTVRFQTRASTGPDSIPLPQPQPE
jgi:two-component sensor histidine kinase/CheY-like chemotaxis protein